MLPGINFPTCDITDDDQLYKLVFEHYCSDLIKYQFVQSSKFSKKKSAQNYIELQLSLHMYYFNVNLLTLNRQLL